MAGRERRTRPLPGPPPGPPPAPAVLITAKNAALITGMSWTEVKRWARAHGVLVVRMSYRVDAIDATAFLAAVRAATPEDTTPVARTELDSYLISIGVIR